MDDFEALKLRVRELRSEVPSQRGCVARLEAEGFSGPVVAAAVEAVFEEAKQAMRSRYEAQGPQRPGSKLWRSLVAAFKHLLLLALAGVLGTLVAAYVFPKAETLSAAHLVCVGALFLGAKILAAGYRSLFG